MWVECCAKSCFTGAIAWGVFNYEEMSYRSKGYHECWNWFGEICGELKKERRILDTQNFKPTVTNNAFDTVEFIEDFKILFWCQKTMNNYF